MHTTPSAHYRCSCGRLLFKGVMLSARIEIKCRRCSKLVSFDPSDTTDDADRYGMIVDAEGKIMQISDSATTVLGYSREELLSMTTTQLSPYSGTNHGTPSLHNVHSLAFEHTHVTKSGSSVLVHARIHPIRTTRGLEELQFFEVRAPRTVLLRDAPSREGITIRDCIVEVNREGRCVYVSEAFGVLVSKNALSLLGSSVFELFHADDRTAQQLWFTQMLASRSAYSVEGVRLNGTDSEVRFGLHAVPLYRDDGRLRGYSLVFEA